MLYLPRAKERLSPTQLLENASTELLEFEKSNQQSTSVRELKLLAAPACRSYYALAAGSRRDDLSDFDRERILRVLFNVRARLERTIYDRLTSARDLWDYAFTPSFFGRSAKQGVSLRFAILSCVPTESCGGRCYAHDGRDREIHQIFRGCLNYLIARQYEDSSLDSRTKIIGSLKQVTALACEAAREEQLLAKHTDFERLARIRFSHVGEVAATPNFANALARLVKDIDPNMQCVIYTRHPSAKLLDPDLFVINFTLESTDDARRRLAPEAARLVGSAWNGSPVAGVAVNFLEHHVSDFSSATGLGHLCPVTTNHKTVKSCDHAKCDLCFSTVSA